MFYNALQYPHVDIQPAYNEAAVHQFNILRENEV